MRHSYRTTVGRLLQMEALTLIAAVATVLAAWCFLEISDEVLEGETQRLDEWVIALVRGSGRDALKARPSWLTEIVRDLTALGGISLLTLVISATAGYLWICKAYRSMWLVLAASLGGLCLSVLLKGFFQRPRPLVDQDLTHVMTTSFPSGHSMNSAVVYLTLGLLLAELSDRKRVRAYCLVVAILLTLLVGFSRVYLGVHYPTDVFAGWAAGATWAGLCWIVVRYLHHRGDAESIT